MKCFINDDLALSRPPEGPVASYIGPFAEWLGDRDYGLVSMKNQVLMATGFSKWLGQKGIELSDLSDEHPGLICWTERILDGQSVEMTLLFGIDSPTKEAHQFRCGLASEMLGILEHRSDYVGWYMRSCRKFLYLSGACSCD